MTNQKILNSEKQALIQKIARIAAAENDLEFENCYTITLLYYLTQYAGFNLRQIPQPYIQTVTLLYKKPESSYIHYINNINYSTDLYAKAIKNAEIKTIGDDPICPW